MPETIDSTKPKVNKGHLNYLDGIRGLAAFYVMMYHIYHQLTNYQSQHTGPSRLIFLIQKLFGWGGHDCVTVFICLSGFSLAIPLAKSSYTILQSSSQFKNFFIRRALRITPPYYVSIGLIVLIAILFPSLSNPSQTSWDNALPILDVRSIIYHLLFIQALDPSQVFKISPQFWSIGTEAQLYFWLPLVLVPLALRKSMLWGVAASLLACLIFIPLKSVESACLHYVFTFTLGAYAADALYNPSRKEAPKFGIATLVAASLFAVSLIFASASKNSWALRDTILTPVLAVALYSLAKSDKPGQVIQAIRSFLSNRVMSFLGKISYSLYLVHYVVIGFLHALFVSRGLSIHLTVLGLILIAPVLSIAVAKVMQVLVEAPSMNLAKRFREGAIKPVLAESPISV